MFLAQDGSISIFINKLVGKTQWQNNTCSDLLKLHSQMP